MQKKNVLLIGGDGRTHATAWKLKRSPQAGTLYAMPGNPGTAMVGCNNIPLTATENNIGMAVRMAVHLDIDLVIVGTDNALAAGYADMFRKAGLRTFGPDANAARIESSKAYAKMLMRAKGIPTADFEVFSDYDKALDYVCQTNGYIVVKADGLALGKGVYPCDSIAEAETALHKLMVQKKVGKAGETVVIEDRLEGDELSIHAPCDGISTKLLVPVRDHKRLTSDKKSDMTGGMGVFGPINVDPQLLERIEREIVRPCIEELADRGTPFVGCLYPGLMLTKDGPKVLEFNARFGDPETQVLMRLLNEDVDLLEVLLACANGRLNEIELKWKDSKCVSITLATEGYPDKAVTGDKICLDSRYLNDMEDPVIFHAGTSWSKGNLVTSGGRVLSLTHMVKSAEDLRDAYAPLTSGAITFRGMQYRSDIGKAA